MVRAPVTEELETHGLALALPRQRLRPWSALARRLQARRLNMCLHRTLAPDAAPIMCSAVKTERPA